jgi:serine/threonine protein kinase
MGVVYLGEHHGERLAIKCIHSGLAADPEFRIRFRREIDACKKVSGLCCARYIDSDAEAETPWLAVEYIQGPSLAEAVQSQGVLSKQNAFGVTLGIAEGLAAIHRVGLVHRDLKPSNVILGSEGPRIIDFGVVKDGEATSFTRTNATVGSPGWMAPEQFRNGEISAAADVFTWALLTAFAYTGNSPFGLSPPEVQMLRILTDEPDLGGLPKSLGVLCAQSLSKDPTDRPTIYEILSQLMPGVPMTQIQIGLDESVTQIMRNSWVPPATGQPAVQLQANKPRRRLGSLIAIAIVATVMIAGIGLAALQIQRSDSAQSKIADAETSLASISAPESQGPTTSPSSTTVPINLEVVRNEWNAKTASFRPCEVKSDVSIISGKAIAMQGTGSNCNSDGKTNLYSDGSEGVTIWEYEDLGWKQIANQPIGMPVLGFDFQDLTGDGVDEIRISAGARRPVDFVMSNGPAAGFWRLVEFDGAQAVELFVEPNGELSSSILTCIPSCAEGGTTRTYWRYEPKSDGYGQFVRQ